MPLQGRMIAQASPRPDVAQSLLSLTTLHEIMPRLAVSNGRRYIDPLNRAMLEFQVTTVLRKAAFLAADRS